MWLLCLLLLHLASGVSSGLTDWREFIGTHLQSLTGREEKWGLISGRYNNGSFLILPEDFNQVIYLSFDRYNSERLFDNTMHNNNATLANGALVDKVTGSCGMCARLQGGNIVIDGAKLVGIPFLEVTVAMMVQLIRTDGKITLFETIGQRPLSNHNLPQYLLKVEYGKVRWFHRNENGTTVFSILTDAPVVFDKTWTHVAVTYTGLLGKAQIYIDGSLKKEEAADPGVFLSKDWSKYAGVGKFGGQEEMLGYVDEFYIYNKTLSPLELKARIDACKGPKSTLVLHLSFEDKSKRENLALDDSGLSNSARIGNAPVPPGQPTVAPTVPPPPFVNGSCGGGALVSGSAGEIKLDGSTFRNKPIDAVTIALWVNVSSVKGVHYLFDTIGGHSQHKHDQYQLAVKDGAVSWTHHNEYDQKIFAIETDPLIIENQWVHIAATYSSNSAKAKVYINGNLNKEGPGKGRLSEDWDSYAGFGKYKGDAKTSDVFDEIYMFTRELSPFEVRTLYGDCNYGTAKAKSKAANPVFYFGFDRVAGEFVYDDSGSDNDGQLSSLASVTRTSGTCGNGLRLQGGNILLNGRMVKRKPLFGVSIALWLKLDTNRGNQSIFYTINPDNPGNPHEQYAFNIVDGRVRWFHKNEKSQTVFSAMTSAAVVPAGTWTHVCGTYATVGGKSEIYVNGVLKKAEYTGKGTLSQDWDGKVSIGKAYEKGNGKWLELTPLLGVIDEFYFFDRSLTKNEITLLGQTCNYQRVVLHFGFEVFDGKTTYDQSGLANNGNCVNGTTSKGGTCGKALNITMGEIVLDGNSFREKPQKAISIAVWINLLTNRGEHEIFNTIGSRSEHKHDQYHFAVDTGKVVWYHHQEQDTKIFHVVTLPVIPARVWTHVTVTYDSTAMLAKVYVNGKFVKQNSASGFLSQDWGHYAGIGRHFYEKTYLQGLVDEFIMYNYALSENDINFLAVRKCSRK